MTVNIIYEDNHLLVAEKSSNSVIKHKNERNTLKNHLKEFLRGRDAKSFVWLKSLSLIDHNAGGPIIFAKSSRAYARLCKQMEQREIRQLYFAIVHGQMKKDNATVTQYLMTDGKGRLTIASKSNPYATQATFSYYVIERSENYSLIAIPTKTNITDTFRAQLMSLGHSIYGDLEYGWNKDKDLPLALWSVQLRCFHPTIRKRVNFICEPPKHFPWSEFTCCQNIEQTIRQVYQQIKMKHLVK